MQCIRSSCYNGINTALMEAQRDRGNAPWVIIAASNEMSARAAMVDERVLVRGYKIPLKNILRIECFDGDPFDYPGRELFPVSSCNAVKSFLDSGFWQSGCDLVVACPTGIQISPSIASAIANVKGATFVPHPTKKPKLIKKIREMVEAVF